MPNMSKENIYAMMLKTIINERRVQEKYVNKFSEQSKHMSLHNKRISDALLKLIQGESKVYHQFFNPLSYDFLYELKSMIQEDDFSKLPDPIHIREILGTKLESFKTGLKDLTLLFDEEITHDILIPYIKTPPKKEYTLVLDMDETLIHFEQVDDYGQCLIRPGLFEFLHLMAEHFELIIFTASIQEYADWVLDNIDKDNCISHRLY